MEGYSRVITARLPDWLKQRVCRVNDDDGTIASAADSEITYGSSGAAVSYDSGVITARLPAFVTNRILRISEKEEDNRECLESELDDYSPIEAVKRLKRHALPDGKQISDELNYEEDKEKTRELDAFLDRIYASSKEKLIYDGKRSVGRFLKAPYSGRETIDLIGRLSQERDIYNDDICSLQEIVIGERTIDFLVLGYAFPFAQAYLKELYEKVVDGGTTWPIGDEKIYQDIDGAIERFLLSYNEHNCAETSEDVLKIMQENVDVLRGYRAIVAFNLSGRKVGKNVHEKMPLRPHWKSAWKQLQIILNKKRESSEGKDFSKSDLNTWDKLYLRFEDPLIGDSGKMASAFRKDGVKEALYEGYLASEHLATMAKDIIVLGTRKISNSVARKFTRYFYLPFEDFATESVIGIMRSTERFDPRRRVNFWTYSKHWSKAMCFDYIKSYHSISLSNPMFSHLMYLKKMRDYISLGKTSITFEDLVGELFERVMGGNRRIEANLNLAEEKVKILLETEKNIFADSFLEEGDDENKKRLGQNLLEEVDRNMKIEAVFEGLERLSVDERKVIMGAYFGEKNNVEIGRGIGKTRESVRKYKKRGLEKLRRGF